MKNQITEDQELKLKKLEDELRELWETLTPSEKGRRLIFSRYLELQRLVQAIKKRNQFLKKEITNE